MLTEIQPPQAEQISAVSAALEAVVRDHGLTDEDVERRQAVVAIMQDLLLSVLPGKPTQWQSVCLTGDPWGRFIHSFTVCDTLPVLLNLLEKQAEEYQVPFPCIRCFVKNFCWLTSLSFTLINFLSSHLEIRLRLYGSSCTKFGFKDSDVNVDIQYPPDVSGSGWLGLAALL